MYCPGYGFTPICEIRCYIVIYAQNIMKCYFDNIVHSVTKNGQSNTNQRCRNARIKLFCRNKRKEKAQKSLRSQWPSEYYSGGLFIIWNCATGEMTFFSHECREEKMGITISTSQD